MIEVGLNGGVAAGAGQRQLTQTIREDWEAQWLREQRVLARVVEHESHRADAEMPGAISPSAVAADASTEVLPQSPGAHPDLRLDSSSSQPQYGREEAVRIVAHYMRSSGPAVATPAFARERMATDLRVAVGSSERAPPSPRLLPHSVAWSEAEGIGVAMRVPTDVSHDGILAQLRQWMKEGGTRLVRLIVNGRTHSDPSHAAMMTHMRRK